MTVAVAGLTDVGRMRARNEDSFVVLPEAGVAVVADGMGGHPGGDVASRIAAGAAARALEEAFGYEDFEAPPDTRGLGVLMTRALMSAHLEVRMRGEAEPHLTGMGTTLTAMAVDPVSGVYSIGHVGDSRAYRLRSGELTRLTRDDTWIQQQIDAGQISPDRARGHPFTHVLTQCIGLDERPNIHLVDGTAEVGDAYLLCTDGLVGPLDDDAIERILSGNGELAGDAEGALRALIDAANDAGGHDNITAVLVTLS